MEVLQFWDDQEIFPAARRNKFLQNNGLLFVFDIWFRTSGAGKNKPLSALREEHPKAAISFILNVEQFEFPEIREELDKGRFASVAEAVNLNNEGMPLRFYLSARKVPLENYPQLDPVRNKEVWLEGFPTPYCCGAGFYAISSQKKPTWCSLKNDSMSLLLLSRQQYAEYGNTFREIGAQLAAAFYSEDDRDLYLMHRSETEYDPPEYDEDEEYW